MSMQSYFTNGIGFPVESVSDKTVLSFIANHLNTIDDSYAEEKQIIIDTIKNSDIIDSMDDSDSLEDVLDDNVLDAFTAIFDCDVYENHGRDIVAAIIAQETNIEFQYEPAQSDECQGEASIMRPLAEPWCYNHTESSLTEESFINIVTPYAKELNVDPKYIGSIEIEYFG